jgi:hypothetical protein
MKNHFSFAFTTLLLAGAASAQGLYYIGGSETQESLPLRWTAGVAAFYDDNVNAGNPFFGVEDQGTAGFNPYVGLSFINTNPQTTWDVFVRLGLVYYLDAPEGVNATNSQSRAGVNLTHRFNERLRFSSRNFISYELNPDYSVGVANAAQVGETFFWTSDNSIGYRWTERLGTYTGLILNSFSYADNNNNDIFTWTFYNQFRYQISPQTVLTADYRYGQTTSSGFAPESTDQFFLLGAEHRFSPTTLGIIRAGAQFREIDSSPDAIFEEGETFTSPYLEAALNSQLTQEFSVRAYARYGIESVDAVQVLPTNDLVVFNDTQTLRIGVSGEYAFSPMVSIFGGVDYIPTSYSGGQLLNAPGGSTPDLSNELLNANIGLSVRFNEMLTGTVAYNYTTAMSDDLEYQDYDRNRISLGVNAEF